jgi:serine/threonine protein phosphatase 1
MVMADPGGQLFAIGDVHGCRDELAQVLDAIAPGSGDTVVFLGDYIDRGPDSRGVIDDILTWRRATAARVVCLKGNHEDMALGYLGRGGQWGEAWHRNGGGATLRSYGLSSDAAASDAHRRIPPDHLAFLEALVPSHRWGDWIFVHAGVRPGVPLEAQHPEDLLWIREEFLAGRHQLPATIVFGHTPHRQVLDDRPQKVGIDTGCVYGGALTCLVLPEAHLVQVRLGDRQVRRHRLGNPSRA